MIKRSLITTPALCYGGAAVLAIVAAFAFTGNPPSPGFAWVLIAAAAFLVYLGTFLVTTLRTEAQKAFQKQTQIDHLQGQIAEQRRSVDTLAEGLDIAIFMCDPRGTIQYANRRAVEMFRFENPIGRPVLAVTLSYDLEQIVLDAARLHEPQDAELTFTYPDERVGVAKAWTPAETPQRVFLSIYEISDLRRLERVRQDFVSNVSHELRTPLTIIRAMAETLLDDDEPDADLVRKYLPKVIEEVDRLSMISNDLLILSAAESNPVRKHACDICDVFRTVAQQLTKKAVEKGLILTFHGPDSCVIEANTSQMTQVAINLIDNAIHYTAAGNIEVTIEPESGWVKVKVADTGLGIASEHLPRIFERFYRVDKARSRNTGGTGLGLSIVKHIVESHGGSVVVDSALNRGSTFTLRLPKGDVPSGDYPELP